MNKQELNQLPAESIQVLNYWLGEKKLLVSR